jgi:RNA-binding protein
MELTGKQRRYLRGLGHHLEAVVCVGKEGVTEGVTRAADAALAQHELVKVRLLAEAPAGRDEAAEALGAALRASVAQVLGRTILLYRRRPKEPKITLPTAG